MSEQVQQNQKACRAAEGATDAGIAAELLTLLETVTADGTIIDSEANELRGWLDQNRDADLPAIELLCTMLDQILADGKVTPEERKALHKAVERVLPPELREKAKGQRVATELLGKARAQEEKAERRAQALEERERTRPISSANFMVAGGPMRAVARVVDSYLKTGETVFLARDPGNKFDPNAIEIRLRQGYVIGYVPREYASEMALCWMVAASSSLTAPRSSRADTPLSLLSKPFSTSLRRAWRAW